MLKGPVGQFDPKWWRRSRHRFNLARGFSICVCHPNQVDGVKFTLGKESWSKTAPKLQPLLHCFSCKNPVLPVVVGMKMFHSAAHGKNCIAFIGRKNSSLPGICKKCIFANGLYCKVTDGNCSNPSISFGWELFQSIHHPRSVSANRADTDPSRHSRFLVALSHSLQTYIVMGRACISTLQSSKRWKRFALLIA